MIVFDLVAFILLLAMAGGTAWIKSLQPVELIDMGVCLE
jgi:hypothetical protein